MSEDKEEKHKVTRASNGEGFDLQLKDPDGDRKHVRVKLMRGRDLRKVIEIEKESGVDDEGGVEGVNLVDALCNFVVAFTDLAPEEVESLSLEDLHGIREVIRGQVKKLMTG